MTEYDYIVVGAGTAGCVLAARLTEDLGTRVLLLEAGNSGADPRHDPPDRWPELIGTAADWAGVTTAQAEAGPVSYPRGRGLGGSGAINAMAHVRGHRAVYDGWAAGGAAGWDSRTCCRTSGAASTPAAATRRCAAPAARSGSPPSRSRPHPVARVRRGPARAGLPRHDDLSGHRQEGVAWVDLAIAAGRRVSPAGAYLRPVLHRRNLTVQAPAWPPACTCGTAAAPGSATSATRTSAGTHLRGGARVRGRGRLLPAAASCCPGSAPPHSCAPWASIR